MLKVAALVLLAGAAGCGRIGYDPHTGDDDTPIDGPSIDGWVDASCGRAVMLADVGASVGSAPGYFLDLARTQTGFVIVWSAGHARVEISAVASDDVGQFALFQRQRLLSMTEPTALSAAAVGNDVLVGVDDGADILLYPVDAAGLDRGATKVLDRERGYGHDFVSRKPSGEGFLVLGGTETATNAYLRDLDAHPIAGPTTVFARQSSGSAASIFAGGYVVLSSQPSGSSEYCDVVPVTDAITATSAAQEIAMTCHNASVATPASADRVLAAWNCTNDAVWVSAGPPSAALSAPRAVYQGDSATPGSDPRLAPQSDHVWYGYRRGPTFLGRAILDRDGAELLAPSDVHASPRVVAYDLIARGDDGYLVWLEAGTRDELWAMRLCNP